MKRLPLLFTLLALMALSASIAFWVIRLYKPAQHPMAPIVESRVADPMPEAGATLFGGQAAAAVASNYQLTGVVSAGREGVAILVADGQPPKAVQVGKEISSGVVLKEVQAKYVMLSEGGMLKRIELATDAKAGAGMALPTAGMDPNQMSQQAQMQMQNQAQMQQNQQPTPQPMPVPENSSVPVPAGTPMEPPMALPPGVPPPPPPVQMPAPTRNMSGGQPPTQ